MHKIFKNLSSSSDITELVLFLDKLHPEILEESIKSNEKEKSFFLYFSLAIQNNYEKLKLFYDINKRYGYEFKNQFNKEQKEFNELKSILENLNYNERFVIDCLNTVNNEEKIEWIAKTNLLFNAFKLNKIEVLKELEKYPEVWKNEKQLKYIQENYLKNLQLSDIFYKNIQQDNTEEFRKQCKSFVEKELKDIEKSNADFKIEKIVSYLTDMSKKENLFTNEFKEEMVGLSLSAPYTKVTNAILKTLFNETLSSYKPEKPLWIHFENLKNKDILYQFLDNFKWSDFWQDNTGKIHYKVDYLNKALSTMDVSLIEKSYGKDNRTKRNVAITKMVLPLLKDYWTSELDGKIGFTREMLKKSSIFKGQITLHLPINDEEKCKDLINKTLLYKENDQFVFLDNVKIYLKQINGLELVFKNDYLPEETFKKIVENFNSYGFSNEILEVLKEKIIEKKIIIDMQNLEENNFWGNNKKFFEELKTINNYHKMEKRFENIPENKTKKVKI
jgi:hypothetical protein